jgi:hypothetical protein
MKRIMTSAVIVILMLSLNCNTSKPNKPKFLVGYAVPGAFQPFGLAPEKTYAMFTGHAWQQACAPSQQCSAVYTYWFTKKQVYTEGFAINDKIINPTSPKFNMKVYHVAGFPAWDAFVILNGASYSGIINDSDMTISKTVSTDDTMPAYIAPDLTTIAASGAKIRLVTITFNKSVQLCGTPLTGPCITIEAGDHITAVDDSWL